MGGSLPQRGRCSHSRCDVVADIHAKLGTIIKMISENLRVSIRQEHDDVLDTMLRKIANHIVDERLSPDRDHPFWNVAGQGREAGSCPACEHENLRSEEHTSELQS